jgi:outer membrane receptor protein involved in Fe transport
LTPDDVSGDLGWVYRLDDRWNLVANVGRGFRAPNIFDLGTLGPRPGNRFNVANPSLGPEQVYQYDAGFKGAGDGWQFEFMVYRLDYRDRITSVLTGETTADGRDIVQSRNLAEAEIWGVESGLRVRWGERWGLNAVVNYTRGEEREPGSPVEPADRIPPLNGRIGLTWEQSDRLTLESYLEFAAEQDRLASRDVRDPRIDPDGTPGWTTLNFDATYRPDENWRIGLAAENVFDKAYRTHGSGIDAAGRNLSVNVYYDW